MEIDDLVAQCDPATRLAVVQWAMRHIVDHAEEGGSYRYLIYERLGFGPEAYSALLSDGLIISNEFDLNKEELLISALKAKDYARLKKLLNLCDVPDCFNQASMYRGSQQACSDHSKEVGFD